MKNLMIFLLAFLVMVGFSVAVKAQTYSTGGNTQTTQQTAKDKTSGGSGGGYSVTGLPLEFFGTIRRPFNVGFGVQLSNGTAKHMITATGDLGINFQGKQFAGIRAMYYPTFWVGFGLSEYITWGQDVHIGQRVPFGDLLGFSFMSQNDVNLEVEFNLTIPLKKVSPYKHKFSLRVVPIGIIHDRYSAHNWSIPWQNFDLGLSYTYAIPMGGGKNAKK
jgi:hypothetical protein